MKTSLALLILPALATAAHNHVYVLGTTPSHRATLSHALSKLGYTASSSSSPSSDLENLEYRYTELADLAALNDDNNPDAKYIILGSNDPSSQLVVMDGSDAKDDLWPRAGMRMMMANETAVPQESLLKLRLGPHDAPRTQAETWVELCDFLGLGYSVVERLKLWQFP